MLKKIKIGLLHGINYIKKNLAIRIPCIYLIPKPQAIYLIPSIKCNSKCIMCSFWSKKDVTLSFKQWQKVIDNLYDWCGPYVKINISGGETLLPGVMHQVISYCIKKFPLTGIVSNGFLIDKKEAKKLIQKNFNNINISIDGNTKKTVNMIRGQPFAFKRSRNAIKYLVNEKNKQKNIQKLLLNLLLWD
ncbi:MAG: radical SAM protein [Parcubacteria group bacterium]|nr:radical SAM protein [Parcubacteria group bacterium]